MLSNSHTMFSSRNTPDDSTDSYREIIFNFGTVDYKEAKNVPFKGNLLLPKEDAENPHIDEVQAKLLKWVVEQNLAAAGSRAYKTLEKLKSAALFSTPLREKNSQTLLLLTKFTSFLFVFDNMIDHALLTTLGMQKETTINKEILSQILEKLKIIFEYLPKCLAGDEKNLDNLPKIYFQTHTDLKSLCQSLIDIQNDINMLIPKESDFFLMSFKEYLNSVFNEVKNRYEENNTVNQSYQANNPIDSYYKYRIHTGGVIPTFALIFDLLQIHFSHDLQSDKTVKKFIENASLMLSLHNDLVSFQMEMKETDHKNAISILYSFYREQKLAPNEAFQKAILDVCKKADDLMRDLFRNYKNLKENCIFAKAAKAIELCIFDNLNWSVYKTGRYNQNFELQFSFSYDNVNDLSYSPKNK